MWIYNTSEWPNFTWDMAKISPLLATVRYQQGLLLGRMAGLGFGLQQEATLNTITTDVITSSAIEGEQLNPDEVRSSIATRLGLDVSGTIPTSRDVDGVVEMMLDATQDYSQPLTAERLFGWHAALFPTGRSGMRPIAVGQWRTDKAGPMQVVSGPVGLEKIHFEAPPASDLDNQMNQFLTWLETPHNEDLILKAGIAHLWFVTLHPFEDGNGRIGRAITDMILARADGTSQRFYSMSRQIERERKEYYTHLEQQQRSDVDITHWLSWFLDCLGRAIANSSDTLAMVNYKAKLWEHVNQLAVNDRQRSMINRMLDGFQGHMTTSKYATLFKCSTDTALRDLQELKAKGILIQNPGAGRSTSYRLITLEELR